MAEFSSKEDLLKLEKENIELRHKYKMEEILAERENHRLNHENELKRIAIKEQAIQSVRGNGGYRRR